MITNDPQLAEVWPEASQALWAFLRSRGSSPQDADDLVQECAIRVLRTAPTYVDAADLLRWCLPVVRNLSVDLHRKGYRELPVESVPDRPVVRDVAEEVTISLELRRVLGALQQLRPSDRDVIVAHVEQEQRGPVDRKQAVRVNVQRHRARQRLLARLAAVLGICAAIGRRAGRAAVPAALPVALAVGLLTTGISAPGATTAPATSTLDEASAGSAVTVTGHLSAQVQLPRPIPARVAYAGSRPARLAGRATMAAATTPEGVGARLAGGDARQPGTLVCVRDVEPLPNTCVARPGPGATFRG